MALDEGWNVQKMQTPRNTKSLLKSKKAAAFKLQPSDRS